MTSTSQENPCLESSDEDIAFVEESFSQNKYLDIFTLFTFLNDPVQLAAKLRHYNILKSTVRCPGSSCRREMKAEKLMCRTDMHGGVVIVENNDLFEQSYFEKSKLPLKKLILLTYCWAYDIPQHAQAKLCGVSYNAAIQWNIYFRDVTTQWLKQNPIKLGGKGVICQIGQLYIPLALLVIFGFFY